MESSLVPALEAVYFDGLSARARPVRLRIDGSVLHVVGEGVNRSVPLADVSWPERTRHGMRVAHFEGGGSVQCSDAAAWDAWSQAGGRRDSLVVRLQQSWRGVLVSVALLVALAVALQQWGLPAAARAVVAATPLSVDESLGVATLEAIDGTLMLPSRLAVAEQARLKAAFESALAAQPAGSVPAWTLAFRRSRIGPNALALPGGTLIVTDELVELVGRDEGVITAVLAHELGHVRHRHGLRALVQVTLLGGLASVVLGDFSSLLAGVPVLMGQASYSREAEREADAEAVRILQAASISPAVMVTLFDKLAQGDGEQDAGADSGRADRQPSWLGIAFASHPADAERVQYFRQAAGRQRR
jgi:Zn-dependent protease with chaperone function